VNLDVQPLPGIDVVADVTRGLRFTGVEAIYAEHFLEHLAIDDAVRFLADCHRALAPGGALRISTPNLEWVWATHYPPGLPEESRQLQAIVANRAFHGWRHRFLWNRPLLGRALAACGFVDVEWCRYGESPREVFRGLEGHDTYTDSEELPHVIIAEAVKADPRPAELDELQRLIADEFLRHLAD
jgi:hypothetical protein